MQGGKATGSAQSVWTQSLRARPMVFLLFPGPWGAVCWFSTPGRMDVECPPSYLSWSWTVIGSWQVVIEGKWQRNGKYLPRMTICDRATLFTMQTRVGKFTKNRGFSWLKANTAWHAEVNIWAKDCFNLFALELPFWRSMPNNTFTKVSKISAREYL